MSNNLKTFKHSVGSFLLLLGSYLLLENSMAEDEENEPKFELSFSSDIKGGVPQINHESEFDCSEQIFSIIQATNLKEDTLAITIIWRNPSGAIQEQTPVTLFPVEGNSLAWAWIKLHQSKGASMFSFFDDSIGMDDFIGDWQVELLINNKVVEKQHFNVLC